MFPLNVFDISKTLSVFLCVSKGGGSFSWTVPDFSTDQARIKVTATIQTFTRFQPPFTVEDSSDADFSIGRLPEAPNGLTARALSS